MVSEAMTRSSIDCLAADNCELDGIRPVVIRSTVVSIVLRTLFRIPSTVITSSLCCFVLRLLHMQASCLVSERNSFSQRLPEP